MASRDARFVVLVSLLFFLAVPSSASACGAATVPGVSPSPLIRLTGVLEATDKPLVSIHPLLSLWIAGKPWLFRVAQVEPVIPAYRALDKLRRVSTLGLRILAEEALVTSLQDVTMRDRPIVIEGWLRPKAGVLRVRSVEAVEGGHGIGLDEEDLIELY